jgi:ABC-2 type transport system ATP-binding protein
MAVIEVSELRKTYGATPAVDGVSFAVEEGEIFGILGPNGAGKTTTVECIAGLRHPDSGSVRVLGLDPGQDRELRELVGVQLQHSALADRLRVREAVQLFATFYRTPADPDELLDTLGLTDKAGTSFAKLSGGQKQRLSIALAIVGNPKVAILDEITTGLDPQARRDTWHLVRRVRDRGTTVILVTHSMEEAEKLCDRVAVLRQGQLVALDTPADLIRSLQSGQTMRFTPSGPLAPADLAGLPGVSGVRAIDRELVVTGSGDLPATVIAELCSRRLLPRGLHLTNASLDDAYLALVSHVDGAE